MSFRSNSSVIQTLADSRITNAISANTVQAFDQQLDDIANLTLSGNAGKAIIVNDAEGTFALSTDVMATQVYVDNAVQGLDVKASVRAATTANITLSNLQTIDGVTLSAGDRVLVKDQTDATANGIYIVVDGSAWTRSEDADGTPASEVSGGLFAFVEEGSTNADTGWVLSSITGNATLGTDLLNFSQFSSAGVASAGAGLSKTGNDFAVNVSGTTTGIDGSDNVIVRSTGTAGQVMLSSGTTGQEAVWGQLDLASADAVTGIVSEANGGTGESTYSAGDLLIGEAGGGLTKLSLGTAGQFLAVNGTADGFEYIDLSANSIEDADGDTRILVEKTADADTIVFESGTSGHATDKKVMEIVGNASNTAGDFVQVTQRATDGEIQLRAGNIAGTGDVNLRLVPQGNGQVFIGDSNADAVIQSDDDQTMTLRGGTNTGTKSGDLILEGGSGATTNAGGMVYIRGGDSATGTDGDVFIQNADSENIAKFSAASGAVNNFEFAGSATGADLSLVAAGTDTNVSIALSPKGAGELVAPTGYEANVVSDEALVNKKWVEDNFVSADKYAVAIVTDATTTLTTEHTVVMTSTAARTVNLPAGATAGAGKVFVIKDGSGSATTNAITIDPNGAETIDGSGTKSIAFDYEAMTIVWNGTEWNII